MEEREKALGSVLLTGNTRKKVYSKVSLQTDSPFLCLHTVFYIYRMIYIINVECMLRICKNYAKEKAMYISICDDNKKERELLATYLCEAVKKRQIYGEIKTFCSGEAFLDFCTEGKDCRINFLDIYMDGISGIELARRILEKDKGAAIVFTTISPDFMAEGFQLGIVHYLVKPFDYKNVEVALERCLRLVGKTERYIELSVDREIRRILFSQIIYVEFQNRYCLICTKDTKLKSYLRLTDLEEKLDDPRFLRCHRSYLVNLDYVSKISGYNFVLHDGFFIPVRREERSVMKLKFENYYFEKSRRDL